MMKTLNSKEQVVAFVQAQANEVYDPCGLALGVSIGIADMGLIRSINVECLETGWHVKLNLRFTSPGCLYFVYFERELGQRLAAVSQIVSLEIEKDHVLDWTPDDLSESAQSKLKEYREMKLSQAAA